MSSSENSNNGIGSQKSRLRKTNMGCNKCFVHTTPNGTSQLWICVMLDWSLFSSVCKSEYSATCDRGRPTSASPWHNDQHYKFSSVAERREQSGAKWDAVLSRDDLRKASNHVAADTKTAQRLPLISMPLCTGIHRLIKTSYCMKMGTLFLWAGKSQSESSELWASSISRRLTC